LLARHDRYVELDTQRPSYEGEDVTVVDRGHVTSLLRPGPLKDHLAGVLAELPATTAVEGSGPTDAPLVVFVHGAGISRHLWRPQLDALADQYRVLAPDLPGHGERTDDPVDFEAAVDIVETAIAQESPDCVVLVGQSLGGYVATEVAARHPERVAGLVLSGSSANYRGLLGLRTALGGSLFRLGARSRLVDDWFERTVESRLRSLPVDDAVVDEILAAGVSLDAWGQAGHALVGYDFPTRLADYDGPVLLVNGADDHVNRPVAADLAADRAAVDAVVIEDAGHTVNLERPDAYTDVVREFVAEQCGGAVADFEDAG
jgi:pimeloyl-ACP methyl ester carboxylesterase